MHSSDTHSTELIGLEITGKAPGYPSMLFMCGPHRVLPKDCCSLAHKWWCSACSGVASTEATVGENQGQAILAAVSSLQEDLA